MKKNQQPLPQDKINGRINCSAAEGETCGNGVKVSYTVSSGESIMLDLDKEGPDWIGAVLSSTVTRSTGVGRRLSTQPPVPSGWLRLALLPLLTMANFLLVT